MISEKQIAGIEVVVLLERRRAIRIRGVARRVRRREWRFRASALPDGTNRSRQNFFPMHDSENSSPRVCLLTGGFSGLALTLASAVLARGSGRIDVVVKARQTFAAAERERANWESVGLATDFQTSS